MSLYDSAYSEAQVDHVLIEALRAGAAGYTPDPEIKTLMKAPDSKWRVMSGVQKCIRRGDVKNAQRLAHALWHGDEQHLWRRLVITAVEDIGIGNPEIAGMVLAVSSKKAVRKEIGERKALFYLIERMCWCLKDRTAPSLVALADHGRHMESVAKALGWASFETCKGWLLDAGRPIEHRMLAA